MATLVLSTVGNALGGPVGGAIGALIGQSIDQQLLGSPRRGPRVGDLSVQSSSYGTQIPRVYGTMRVAGSVVWSTDLVEGEQTAGAKGQPDVTYSYSVSFAVALSSRSAKSVRRIWADGKLLRGAAGDFKTSTDFRFYTGSEDQAIDPLIGSIEGIANTPAYRGLALAVFENLQLADFGNRIPFLTFEIVSDDAPPTVGSVLNDSSGGLVQCDAEQQLVGFAAYGSSIKAAVEPLVDSFGVDMFDDGVLLREATAAIQASVAEDELGNSADNRKEPRLHREQLPVSSVAAAFRLSYYDPARDYQTGEARAVAGEQVGNEAQQDLPAVLNAGDAKSLAQQMLARGWAKRDRLTLRLPPGQLGLEPGSTLSLPFNPSTWLVEKSTIDGFVVVTELRPWVGASVAVAADSGRIVANSDIVEGPLSLALLDIPNVLAPGSNDPTVLVAASTSTSGWKRRIVQVEVGGQTITSDTARAKSLLGSAASVLAPAGAELVDEVNSVDVTLLDPDQWLTSCDDDALASGENLALLGSELIQFGSAAALGAGRFRLSHLLRGRGGTEWASGGHTMGELFSMVDAVSLQPVILPNWSVGSVVSAQTADAATSVTFGGESLRPPSPVNLVVVPQDGGGLLLSWTRRSRLGFAWVDDIDAPLGEAREQYRVNLTGSVASLEIYADQPTVTISAADAAALGSGPVVVEVRQIGDLAASRPAQLSFTL